MLRTVRKLKKKHQVLTDHMLWRVTEVDNALPPAGLKEMHHCEKWTIYQKTKSTQRHCVVKACLSPDLPLDTGIKMRYTPALNREGNPMDLITSMCCWYAM